MSASLEEDLCALLTDLRRSRGKPGSPPDPVRLLQMAQALYEAEEKQFEAAAKPAPQVCGSQTPEFNPQASLPRTDDPQVGQEPFGWQVAGTHELHRGRYAELDARASAKSIGGTCMAFPLYTAPLAAPMPITEQQARDMGAKGAAPTEAERVLFEAWMRGHCWSVVGEWDGRQYKHAHEANGFVHPGAMDTRRLWAAWRDRAALADHSA